jgi:membrane protein DedA with SNARE-associated domain
VEYVFNILTTCFQDLRYVGIFLAFVVAGVGVPIPEDVILLAAGYMAHLEPDPARRLFALKLAIAVCMAGIFVGDTLIYWMGRIWGTRLLRVPILRKTLTVKNIKKMEAYFAKYGDKTVFFARFFAGVRMAAFFTAGAMRMRYWKFIAVDMLAALTSPIWVVLAWRFGDRIDDAFAAAKSAKHYVLLAVFALLGAYILYVILRRQREAK